MGRVLCLRREFVVVGAGVCRDYDSKAGVPTFPQVISPQGETRGLKCPAAGHSCVDTPSFGRRGFTVLIGVVAKVCDSNTDSRKGDSRRTKIKQGRDTPSWLIRSQTLPCPSTPRLGFSPANFLLHFVVLRAFLSVSWKLDRFIALVLPIGSPFSCIFIHIHRAF